jgi:MFS family permease
MAITLASYFRLLRHNRNFRRLWLAQLISETGDWFYMVSLYAMLLQFTGSAQTLGVAFTLQVLPQALTGPIAGVVNDRISRRHVMVATDLARFVIIGMMLLVRSPQMIWLAYLLLFSETVAWGFFEAGRNAVLPNIVAADEIIVANTIASTTWSMNLFLGSAIGGLVAVWLGRQAVLMIDMSSFLFSAALIGGMRFHEPHTTAHGKLRLRDLFDYSPMLEGVRYVRGQAKIARTIFVKAGLGLAGSSWVIFPVLAHDVFPWAGAATRERSDLISLSLLMGARGLGSVLGPLVAARFAQQHQRRLRRGIVIAFVLYGLGYILLARITNVWAAYAVIIPSHMGGAMAWVFSTTLLQLMTEDKYRGRVFAAELGFCTIALAASAYAAGLALDKGITIQTVLWVTGAATVAAGVWWAMTGARERQNA